MVGRGQTDWPTFQKELIGVTAAPQMIAAPRARDQDAGLAESGQVWVGGVRAEPPHDRRDDQREHRQNQPDGHHRAHDRAQLRDPWQPVIVRRDVDLHRQHERQARHHSSHQVKHSKLLRSRRPAADSGKRRSRSACQVRSRLLPFDACQEVSRQRELPESTMM